jgi:hypothetical protein
MLAVKKGNNLKKPKLSGSLHKIKVLFDSTKTEEYKGAHSIGCKN